MHSTIVNMQPLGMMPQRVVSAGPTHTAGRGVAQPFPHLGHHHHHHPWSRRHFLQMSAALVGTAASVSFLGGTALAAKPGTGIPQPVAGFSPVLKSITGLEIPFFLPIEADPFAGVFNPVANASLIGDFNGFLGLVEADGVNDPNNSSDGEARRWAADIRFMTGVFRDRQGRSQHGTFGFF